MKVIGVYQSEGEEPIIMTSEIWSEKERDECYDFLEELLKVESLDEPCEEEK